MEVWADTPQGDKLVGELIDGILVKKNAQKSIHFFRKFSAWGFDKDAIDNISREKDLPFDGIEIREIEEGLTYRIERVAFEKARFIENFRWGTQYLVQVGHFDIFDSDQLEPWKTGEEQMILFGG